MMLHTDLVEATLIREDGDVSVISCTSCSIALVTASFVMMPNATMQGCLLHTGHD